MKKYLLLLLLFISGVVSAQYPITGSKVRYYNGIGLSTRDTTGWSAADTNVVIIGADSALYVRAKTYWKKVGGSDKAYYTIQQSSDSTYVTIKSIDGLQVDTIHFQGGSGVLSSVVSSGTYPITNFVDSGYSHSTWFPNPMNYYDTLPIPDIITYNRIGNIVTFSALITADYDASVYPTTTPTGFYIDLPLFEKSYITNFIGNDGLPLSNQSFVYMIGSNHMFVYFNRNFTNVSFYVLGQYKLN
jgi:hypothetical protein